MDLLSRIKYKSIIKLQTIKYMSYKHESFVNKKQKQTDWLHKIRTYILRGTTGKTQTAMTIEVLYWESTLPFPPPTQTVFQLHQGERV